MATTTRTRNNGTAESARDAKQPVSAVAGPYGHPFHPLLVTLPIGAWVASFIFDVASRAGDGSRALVDASHWLILVGVIGAAVAALFGLMDFMTIPRRTKAQMTGLIHMLLNSSVLVLFIVNFVWRQSNADTLTKVKAGQLGLSAVSLVLLGISGWLGGKLTYRYGVRVAVEADQAEGYQTDARTA